MKTVMRTVVRIFWGKHLSLARPSVAVRRPSRPRPAQRLRHATTNQQRCGYPPRRPARPRELVRCNRSCPRRTDLSSVERDGEGAICIVAEMGSMPQLSSSRTSLSRFSTHFSSSPSPPPDFWDADSSFFFADRARCLWKDVSGTCGYACEPMSICVYAA